MVYGSAVKSETRWNRADIAKVIEKYDGRDVWVLILLFNILVKVFFYCFLLQFYEPVSQVSFSASLMVAIRQGVSIVGFWALGNSTLKRLLKDEFQWEGSSIFNLLES